MDAFRFDRGLRREPLGAKRWGRAPARLGSRRGVTTMDVQGEIRSERLRLDVSITSLGGFQFDSSQEPKEVGVDYEGQPGRSILKTCFHCSRNCQTGQAQWWSLKLFASHVSVVKRHKKAQGRSLFRPRGASHPRCNNITATGYDLGLTLTSVSTGSKDSALEMQLGAKLNSIFRVCV